MDAVTKPYGEPLQMHRIMFTIQRCAGACATIWMSNGPGLDKELFVPIEMSRRPRLASSAIMQPSVELNDCLSEHVVLMENQRISHPWEVLGSHFISYTDGIHSFIVIMTLSWIKKKCILLMFRLTLWELSRVSCLEKSHDDSYLNVNLF